MRPMVLETMAPEEVAEMRAYFGKIRDRADWTWGVLPQSAKVMRYARWLERRADELAAAARKVKAEADECLAILAEEDVGATLAPLPASRVLGRALRSYEGKETRAPRAGRSR